MTAVPLEAPIVDLDKVGADIAAVLVQHGIVAPEGIRITLTPLGHGDRTGLQVTAFGDPVTTRPYVREDAQFDAIVDQIREES